VNFFSLSTLISKMGSTTVPSATFSCLATSMNTYTTSSVTLHIGIVP
jgi:hypothetical protein